MTPGDVLTALRDLAPVTADGDTLILPPGTDLPAPLREDAHRHKKAILELLRLEPRLCRGMDEFLWPVEQSWTAETRRRIQETGLSGDPQYDEALPLFENLLEQLEGISNGTIRPGERVKKGAMA